MNVKLLHLPDELKVPLKEVEAQLLFSLSEDGVPVEVRQNKTGPRIVMENGKFTLEYHKKPEFFRALTLLPDRIGKGGVYQETPAHEDLCVMADCSRNAVLNVPSAKRMVRYLALMGFTSFMLYTEDTYEIPESPYFGYQRGRYTHEELKEIDRYAQQFGIEVIPCIQVLAHLEGSLRWQEFADVTDVGNILLVGEEKTYALIDNMLKTCRECFSTNRIHLGMDEAHLLGSGKYLDRNGYRSRSDIILEHLNRVVAMCEGYQFNPMIWSDMFFRIPFHTYYVEQGEIPAEVIELVPKNLTLVYWDYYTFPEQEARFRHMFHCHKQFHNPMAFAGGAWKWSGLAPNNIFSLHVNDLQLKIAKEEKVPMVIATCWGDNGAESSHFSIMAVLQQYAEYMYADGENRDWVKQRFNATFGMPFDDFVLLDLPNQLSDTDPKRYRHPVAKVLFYNDPLGGWNDFAAKEPYAAEYAEKQKKLEAVPANPFSLIFKAEAALCGALALKATLSLDTRKAYKANDRAALETIVKERIPATIDAADAYLTAAREAWYAESKTYGFDVVELRIGGLKERLRSAALELQRYLDGKVDSIHQLEQDALPMSEKLCNTWRLIVSGCIV